MWSETHRVLHGEPFTLKDYPYMDDIYADQAQEIIILKSAQSACSEYLVSTMAWFVDTNRGNTYFAFPTMKDVGVFVQGRVDSAIDETPYLENQLKGKADNVSIKRFGTHNMYFTGTQKRTQIISSPADIILEDEYDEHNPDVHNTVEKRLNNSKWKWKRRISTPTYPDYGIHKKWKESDQRCWFSRCKNCRQNIRCSGDDFGDRWMEFITDNNITGKKSYCCPLCKSLEFDPVHGYWEATADSVIHGYSINRMMTKSCTAQELWDAYQNATKDDTVDEFFMSDLGCPYQPKGSRLHENDLHNLTLIKPFACLSMPIEGRDYFIGIDTGKKLHATVLEYWNEEYRIVWAGILNKYEEIEELINIWNPLSVVCDLRPEPTPIMALNKKYSHLKGAEHNNGMIKPTMLGKEEFVVYWNKYCSIEHMYNFVTNQRILLPSNINLLTDKDFYRHFCTYMRVERMTEKGDKIREFISTNGKKQADHFLFSSIFAFTAKDAYDEYISKRKMTESGFLLI